jgi:hypothetical protein
MIAIQVDIDGVRYAVIGAEDWSLLHAEVIAMFAEPDSKVRDGYIEFNAHGMTVPNSQDIRHHLRWTRHPLSVGSVVTMKVVDTDKVNPPKNRYRSDAKVQENPFTDEEMREMRRKDYLSLKAEFEGKADG